MVQKLQPETSISNTLHVAHRNHAYTCMFSDNVHGRVGAEVQYYGHGICAVRECSDREFKKQNKRH